MTPAVATPAERERTAVEYPLTYQVHAATRLDALYAVNALLRTGVVVRDVVAITEYVPGWWEVELAVSEKLPPAPAPYAGWSEPELREAHGGR